MTDWEKLKVTDLKDELKARGVPLTGLKLKQQLIDKLNELDADAEQTDVTKKIADEDENESAGEVNNQNEALSEGEEHDSAPSNDPYDDKHKDSKDEELSKSKGTPRRDASPDQGTLQENITQSEASFDESNNTIQSLQETSPSDRVERLPKGLPAELVKEESQAQDVATPPAVEAETISEEKLIKKDDPFILQKTKNSAQEDKMAVDLPDDTDSVDGNLEKPRRIEEDPMHEQANTNEAAKETDEPASSTRVPTPETLDDHRKRKRRSATPAPDVEDIARKRAKANNGTPIPAESKSNTLAKVQEATDAAKAIRDPEDQSALSVSRSRDNQVTKNESMFPMEAGNDPERVDTQRSQQRYEASRSPSHNSPERDVNPAMHPATSSLYIRNFKRPLHIPTLRAHISELAGSSTGDPIRLFYLDNIRTHAFVSFASISAASRVRNALHETRFPDEPMRDPLWIDFIPDEKVQSWIDQESGFGGGGFGSGRGSSKKYEVVYIDGVEGVEAILQQASGVSTLPQRPGVQQSRSNRMVSQDPTATAAVTAGIHPSRTSIVPQSPTTTRTRDTRPQSPPPRPSDPGKGFKALDELFSSTTTKPKLYYKLPPQTQIDDRLDMMRDLRVDHEQMGQSGDEGMKRYSFEKDERSGREEWVDKGPEFGFGRRGQERLTGFGTSYGRGRGRGGFRGTRRGGDSWRGG